MELLLERHFIFYLLQMTTVVVCASSYRMYQTRPSLEPQPEDFNLIDLVWDMGDRIANSWLSLSDMLHSRKNKRKAALVKGMQSGHIV